MLSSVYNCASSHIEHDWVLSPYDHKINMSERSVYHRAGWCAPGLELPDCSVEGLQQDPGSMASSLSGEMRSEQGPEHGQTHGAALWTDQCLQKLKGQIQRKCNYRRMQHSSSATRCWTEQRTYCMANFDLWAKLQNRMESPKSALLLCMHTVKYGANGTMF